MWSGTRRHYRYYHHYYRAVRAVVAEQLLGENRVSRADFRDIGTGFRPFESHVRDRPTTGPPTVRLGTSAAR